MAGHSDSDSNDWPCDCSTYQTFDSSGRKVLYLISHSLIVTHPFLIADPRFIEQFRAGSINKFKPFSKHPACFKDISFWLNTPDFHSNNFFELVREIAGDLAEDVQLVDQFTHPKTQRRSLCYRINYRSMDRTLTNEEIDALQGRLRERLPAVFSVELR
jgi:phenylalanyl-tRNA synthetase alpha chain